MAKPPLFLLTVALLAAGCLGGAGDADDTKDHLPDDDVPVEPTVQSFQGRMTASALAALAHQDEETEMAVADVQREGFVLEVLEVPDRLEVLVAWSSPTPTAEMLSMINIPTATEGQVLDVFSGWQSAASFCIALPLDELEPGLLSVMAHSRNAAAVDYSMDIKTWGGDVVLHEDRGHMEVEREGGEEREALPCLDEAGEAI